MYRINCMAAFLLFVGNLCPTLGAQCVESLGASSLLDQSAGNDAWGSNHLLLASSPAAASPLSGSGEVGAIFLGRSNASDQTLALDQDGAILLNASDLSAEMGGGIFFKFAFLNIAPTRPLDLEFEMFAIDEIASRDVVSADEVINVFYNSVPASPTQSETFDYVSDLQNYELNWRFRVCPRIRLLTGLRYLRVEELYNTFNTGGGTQRVGSFSNLNNDLLGGQIGAAATFWQNDFWSLFGSFKYAFLNNSVEGGASARNSSGDPLDIEFDGESSSRLWDVELGAYTTITEQLGLKVGYRGLVAEDIAIAPDQSGAFDIFTGDGSVAFSNAEWHGLFVTLEAVW